MSDSPSKVVKLNDGGINWALRKQRNVSEELAAARETTQRIKGLDYSQFSNEGVSTTLPYPALDHVFAGARPGKVVKFVGRRNLYPAALKHVLKPQTLEYDGEVWAVYEGVVVTGPSGSGKSCLIRALACQLIATLPETTKVICFWYFNAFRALHRQVQDALLFTYCNECEVDTGLAQRILQIKDVQALRDFLLERIEEMGQTFYVVTDGEERLGRLKSDGSERGNEASRRRAEARLWLGTIYDYADFEMKALSPKAEEASPLGRKPLFRWEVKELFQKVEVQTFLANTLLGRLLAKREKRWSDVEFFAGAHPLSLWRLQICCMEYVLAQEPVGEGQDWIHLFDKHSWSSVLASFRCGEPFQQIRESLKATDDTSAVERSFRLGKGFCSDYVQTVYMEAVVKNAEARKFRCRELTGYVNMMLRRGVDFHSWSALGWACETFVGDAVLKVGLTISGLEHIAPKTVVILYGGQPTKLNATKLKPGNSAYWTPARYSFKYIDGIALHMDKQGVLHLIAVQDTVDPKEQRRTEHKFMQERHVQRWWASRETIQLHYVYMCPQMPADMDRISKVEKGHLVAGKRSELDYFVHVEPMADCIPKMHEKEYELLWSLAHAREDAVKKRAKEKREQNEEYHKVVCALPDELQKMHGRKRAELEEMARSNAMFQTKLELVKAINGL